MMTGDRFHRAWGIQQQEHLNVVPAVQPAGEMEKV
jgi:hypothetical protein